MGGLGPGIGGGEWLVIAVVALLVVGPERLPGMLREMGKWVARARNMANEFRASFDDMARQSELDELRKEVEALRSGSPVRLGADADAAFKDIKAEFDRPLFDPTAPMAESTAADSPIAEPVMTPAPSEWPVDTGAVVDTQAPEPVAQATPAPKARTKRAAVKPKTEAAAKPRTDKPKSATSGATKAKTSKPHVRRTKAADL